MTTGPSQSAAAEAKRRWYRLTPDRLVWLVLVIEGLLWLAERFGCFPKGYAVLLAVASVAAAMLVMLLWFAASLVFRWRFQFSVGSLMVLAVVVATLCGWFGVEKKEATEQKEAVAGIEKLKGFVSYDYMGDSGEWRGRARLRGLLGDDFFWEVVHADIYNDAQAAYLKGLAYLPALELWDLTCDGLENLKALPRLKELELSGTQITSNYLRKLSGVTDLQELTLDGDQVTDSVLEGLKFFPKLQRLSLPRRKFPMRGWKKSRH